YNLQPNDILNVARSLSTVNNLTKAYLVHSAGRWETRAGSLQMEQEAGDLGSTVAAIFGLTPDRVSDAYLRVKSNKEYDQVKRDLERMAKKDFEIAMKYGADGNIEMMEAYLNRAKVPVYLGPYDVVERGEMFRRIMQGNEELVQQAETEFV